MPRKPAKRTAPAKRRAKKLSTPARAARRTNNTPPRRGRPRTAIRKRPFSLMLSEAELSILRDIADRENTSVATVIRNAMNVVFFSAHPDLARTAVAENVDRFFTDLTDKLPLNSRFNAKRTAIKKRLVQDLVKELNLVKK